MREKGTADSEEKSSKEEGKKDASGRRIGVDALLIQMAPKQREFQKKEGVRGRLAETGSIDRLRGKRRKIFQPSPRGR